MSDVATAELAATTDWRTYDGPVTSEHIFKVVFFPVAMVLFLVLPTALCYCCLSRGRVVPYTPPNHWGGADYGKAYLALVFGELCVVCALCLDVTD